jgi:hypothetical protein
MVHVRPFSLSSLFLIESRTYSAAATQTAIDREDQQRHYQATVYGGLKGGALALGAGGAGAFALQRSGNKAFAGLTLPLKAFALTYVTFTHGRVGGDSNAGELTFSSPTSSFSPISLFPFPFPSIKRFSHTAPSPPPVSSSRRTSRLASTSSASTASVPERNSSASRTRDNGLSRRLALPATSLLRSHIARRRRSSSGRRRTGGRRSVFRSSFFPSPSRYFALLTLFPHRWAASMVGSGAYIASSPLSFAQKLVQVRRFSLLLTPLPLFPFPSPSSPPSFPFMYLVSFPDAPAPPRPLFLFPSSSFFS